MKTERSKDLRDAAASPFFLFWTPIIVSNGTSVLGMLIQYGGSMMLCKPPKLHSELMLL